MNFVVLYSVIALHLISNIEIIEAEEICTLPNGGSGTCVLISRCDPLEEIDDNDEKSEDERLFLHQSYCRSSRRHKRSPKRIRVNAPYSGVSLKVKRKKKVCCPAQSEWAQYEPIPNKNESPEREPEDKISTKPNEEDTKTVFDYGEVVSGARFCGVDKTSTNKITGGSITSVDQYPWLVLLEYPGGGLDCGGSLISPRFVLTAAHCLDSRSGVPIIARLGEYNTSSFPTDIVPVNGGGVERVTVQLVRVENAFVHREFDRNRFVNDIGLVKLAQDVVFSDFVKAVCLPGKDFVRGFNLATKLTVAGWGEDPNDRRFDDVKKDVYVPYVALSECERNRRGQIFETQICAGGEEGKDTCQGDSGGPLMYEYKQVHIVVGITSYGNMNCGTKGEPAVYTNVYKYLDWIKDALEGSMRF